jgi:restriction system protein
MSIPDYQTIMLPLLRIAADGEEHPIREATEVLADHFDLSDDERKVPLPSGGQALFVNRVGWTRTYMKKAGLLIYRRRGHFKITTRGQKLLQENPRKIDSKMLESYSEFRTFRVKRRAERSR